MFRKLIAMAALLISTPVAAADTSIYQQFDDWLVLRDDSSCAMGTEYASGSTVYLSYDARLKTVGVAFSDPSIKSLKAGDKRKLKTYFITGGELDEGWGEKEFVVFVGKSGDVSFTRPMSEQFLTDFARSTNLAFYYGEVLLKSFDLSGTAPVIASLRRCADEQLRRNPSDPFAGES